MQVYNKIRSIHDLKSQIFIAAGHRPAATDLRKAVIPPQKVKANLWVKGARFTLNPASGAGFRYIVKGESSVRKPPE
jgi:hypothetical protein